MMSERVPEFYRRGNESGLLSCFLASPTLRAALVKSSWLTYSLRKDTNVVVSLGVAGTEFRARVLTDHPGWRTCPPQ